MVISTLEIGHETGGMAKGNTNEPTVTCIQVTGRMISSMVKESKSGQARLNSKAHISTGSVAKVK